MSRTSLLALILICVGAVQVAASPEPAPSPLWGTAIDSLSSTGALANASLDVRARAAVCALKAKAFRSRLPRISGPPGPETWTHEKRRGLERDLVMCVAAPAIEDTAAAYATRATLFYEWEGSAEGPLAEAAFAEGYLKVHPGTPLRPYLSLFLAHRYRCAFEILSQGGAPSECAEAGERYAAALRRARSDPDPLIRTVAEEIDARPFLYLEADRPPRPVGPISWDCPDSASPETIADPRAWALRCFGLSAGPDAAQPGSITETAADIDGDGVDELLIGSTADRGNAGGTHYVFRSEGGAFIYLGSVFLHPQAWKALGPGLDEKPRLLRYRRLGSDEGLLDTIVYDGGAFAVETSETVHPQGDDRARLCAFLGIMCERDSTPAGAGQILPLRTALDRSDAYVRSAGIDLSEQRLQSATLRYDAVERAPYWHLQWMWSEPRIGGEFGLRVYMDGRIVVARLGP